MNSLTGFAKFKHQATILYDNYYIYEEKYFINSSKKAGVICPGHGLFYIYPCNHLNGTACPACYKIRKAKENEIKTAVLTSEEFYSTLSDENKQIYDSYEFNKNEIKDFIKQYLFDSSQRLSSNTANILWLNKNNFVKELIGIYSLTKFSQSMSITTRCKYILEDTNEQPKCLVCNEEISGYGKTKTFCSKECQKTTHKEIKFCKICGKETMNNRHEYCSRKCLNKDKEFVKIRSENSAKGNIRNHGGVHGSATKEVKLKIIKTTFNKFGTDNVGKLIGVKNKVEKFKDKYLPLFDLDNPPDFINRKWLCLKCNNAISENTGVNFENIVRCYDCYPYNNTKAETELVYFIKEIFEGKIIRNTRKVISPYELDIYLPDKNFAIEYNGLYWHSAKDENYHLNKTKLCVDKDINLLHILDIEWKNKQKLWKNLIKSDILKIGISNMDIKKLVDAVFVKEYFDRYSLEEFVEGEYFGLFSKNHLEAIFIIKNNIIVKWALNSKHSLKIITKEFIKQYNKTLYFNIDNKYNPFFNEFEMLEEKEPILLNYQFNSIWSSGSTTYKLF